VRIDGYKDSTAPRLQDVDEAAARAYIARPMTTVCVSLSFRRRAIGAVSAFGRV
jgi:hypothetical protein